MIYNQYIIYIYEAFLLPQETPGFALKASN